MTIEQYYIIAGAAGIAGAMFCLYIVAMCLGRLFHGFMELAAVEDYERP